MYKVSLPALRLSQRKIKLFLGVMHSACTVFGCAQVRLRFGLSKEKSSFFFGYALSLHYLCISQVRCSGTGKLKNTYFKPLYKVYINCAKSNLIFNNLDNEEYSGYWSYRPNWF